MQDNVVAAMSAGPLAIGIQDGLVVAYGTGAERDVRPPLEPPDRSVLGTSRNCARRTRLRTEGPGPF